MGYLATRVPVQALLHLRHPEAEDPAAEHPWCAWDICEGGFRGLAPPLAFCPALSPRLSSEVLPSNLLALPGSVTGSQLADLACAGETGKMCLGSGVHELPSPPLFSPFSLGRETWLQDS